MGMKRRDFLKRGAVLGTTAFTVGSIPSVFAAKEKVAELKKSKRIPSKDPCAMIPLTDQVTCTRIGFGTGMRGYNRESNITRMGEEKSMPLLRHAYDRGIRLFDMADLYGSHPVVTKALEGKPRDSYTLVSKIWFHENGLPEKERPDADVAVKRFLKECKTDYLDVVQIHCMMDDKWADPDRFAKQMEIMERLKEEGLIRAHGVSCHANSALAVAAKTPWADVVHARINHEGAKMDGPVDNVLEVVKACHDSGCGVIAMKVIGEGTFADDPEKRKKSADFVTQLECVDVMVVGFTEIQHVDELLDNVKASLEKNPA